MKISERQLSALIWAGQKGLSPSCFRSDDLFIGVGGVYTLQEADPETTVWLPRLPTLIRLLRKRMKVVLRERQRGVMHLLSAEYKGLVVEGAGLSETEAVLTFLERLHNVDICRVSISDRPRSTEDCTEGE